MTTVAFNFGLEYDDKLAQVFLDALAAKMINLEPEFRESEQYLFSQVQLNLNRQENPDGSKFPVTVEDQRRALLTTNYRNSISVVADGNGVNVKSDHPGAATHTLGLSVNIWGRGVLYPFPVRDPFWFSNEALKRVADNIFRGF